MTGKLTAIIYGGSLAADRYGGALLELFGVTITAGAQLYDEVSGSLLYDEVTGNPITA